MALNKENKRRSISGIGTPYMVIPPAPDGSISKADRRAIAGVYWGFLDTGLALGSTAKYDDAKTLYDGEDRKHAGTLPHNLLWVITGGTPPNEITNTDRADFLATKFFAVPCNGVTEIDSDTIKVGSDKVGDYVAKPENASLPITLRTSWNLLVSTIAENDGVSLPTLYPCWSNLGTHIGSEGALSTCLPTALVAAQRYRFHTGCSVNNPRAVDKDKASLDADLNPRRFRVPSFPATGKDKQGNDIGSVGETISFWEKGTELNGIKLSSLQVPHPRF